MSSDQRKHCWGIAGALAVAVALLGVIAGLEHAIRNQHLLGTAACVLLGIGVTCVGYLLGRAAA